ncbi:hypothetical protein JXB31_01000, partial [Candidatus Woesearchaeota archaeon]|nr:hypothetical protein [Candidatus Woesearchaeota archaeon]
AINLNPPVHTKNSNTGMHKTEKIPNIFETIMQTVHMFEHGCTMAMLKNYEPDVLIEPKLLDMKPVEFSNLKLYYEKSMEECRKSKQKLIKLI